MSERRRATRFAFSQPAAAHIRTREDVVIEHVHGEALSVIASAPSVRDEELTLEIDGARGGVLTVAARTVESQPILIGGRVQHRLTLHILDTTWTEKTGSLRS